MPSNSHANSQQLDKDMMVYIWVLKEGLYNGDRTFETYHIHWLIHPPTGRTAEQFSDNLSGEGKKKYPTRVPELMLQYTVKLCSEKQVGQEHCRKQTGFLKAGQRSQIQLDLLSRPATKICISLILG